MPCTLERSGLRQMKVIEQKIRSLYHSTVFLWLVSAFFHIFSFFWVCLCRHFVCFSPVSKPRTQILSLFILAAILNTFPFSVDKSVTWFLPCARVFSPAAAIWESEKTLGTRLSKKATEIGSRALCLRQKALLCTETWHNIIGCVILQNRNC